MLKDIFKYTLLAPYEYLRRDINEYKSLKQDIKKLKLSLLDASSVITACRDEADPACGCITNYFYYIGKGGQVKKLGYYKHYCQNFNGNPCKEICDYKSANHNFYEIKAELEKKQEEKNNFWLNKLKRIR